MYLLSIWSLSTHLQKKVLPSIQSNRKIKIVSVLSKKDKKKIKLKKIMFYNDKEKFFLKNQFDYVYISSINSKHYDDCKFAIENNKNVICEKPICLNKSQLIKLKTLAFKKKKKFFEVVQYVHHPLFTKLKSVIKNNSIGKVLSVKSSFKIPLSDKENFRFNKKYGGGALNDVGFYPISIMFTLFNSKKIKIINSKISKEKDLDIKGDIVAQNEKKILFNLAWAFNSPYENKVKIIGKQGIIDIDFIFSKNIVQNAKINIIKKNKKIIKIKKSNQINLAFNNLITSTQKKFLRKSEISLKILKTIENFKKLSNTY